MMNALIETPGITVKSGFRIPAVLALWPKPVRDFGDAVLASCAREEKLPVMTFDKKFTTQLKSAGMPFHSPR